VKGDRACSWPSANRMVIHVQDVSDKLPSGRANDWPFQGVCSSPLVEATPLLRDQPL